MMKCLYHESLRPQFHFTAKQNWLNDPNGLVYYKGEFHLFFQHNPSGIEWGNMTWGHAVSDNLVQWKQLPDTLEPDEMGTMFSGSAVVDWHNSAGFQTGNDPPLIAIYTAAGGTSPASQGKPFTQCLAYSNDAGRTWRKYAGNPVVPQIAEDIGNTRDPKVFWHAPTGQWIMVLYVGIPAGDRKDAKGNRHCVHMVYFLASPDLKTWTFRSAVDGFYECPDLFELPVEGSPGDTRWVLYGADGQYWIGRFDGTSFTRQDGFHRLDWGANYYAAQTYSDAPDGRRILISWMRGGSYPNMPFNQQMTVPTVLSMRQTPLGLRVHRQPVAEIETLRTKRHEWTDLTIAAGQQVLEVIEHDLLDIELDASLGTAEEVGLEIFGHRIGLRRDKQLVTAGGSADLPDNAGRITLRILVDHSSIEVFANDGREVVSFCYLPKTGSKPAQLYSNGGDGKINSLVVHELKSAW